MSRRDTRTGPDTFTATAAWPAADPFHVSRLGPHDPLPLSETARQAALAGS
ncbi:MULTISPECIES: AfsA-related hotdog domain-containing protein [unclassified Streptomyces]|uniref:AfsA-related hotdog domain-containing protein n=1 Tax=unclassified Streptomyces TaxID=2593676 RepID=UPI00338EAED1